MATRACTSVPALVLSLTMASFASLTAPESAAADAGYVELVRGGRVNGNVMAVMVGERVLVRLEDGTTMTLGWADVLRVQDGELTYERSGATRDPNPLAPTGERPATSLTRPASTPQAAPQATPSERRATAPAAAPRPLAPQAATASGTMSRADVLRLVLEVDRLPDRGGTALLVTFGTLFLANAITQYVVAGASFGWHCDGESGLCEQAAGFALFGVGSTAVGVAMVLRGAGRARKRRRLTRELLESEGFMVASRPTLRFDPSVGTSAFVSRLTLTF